MENKLNHFDQKGNAVMVDVSGKVPTSRTAVAKGKIRVCQAVMDAVKQRSVKKGDVLGVARGSWDHGGEADIPSDSHVPSADDPEMFRGL